MTCRKPDIFLLAATIAASLILLRLLLRLFYHLLRAQVLYHVLSKMSESENEENIMCLLLPASAHFELYRKN